MCREARESLVPQAGSKSILSPSGSKKSSSVSFVLTDTTGPQIQHTTDNTDGEKNKEILNEKTDEIEDVSDVEKKDRIQNKKENMSGNKVIISEIKTENNDDGEESDYEENKRFQSTMNSDNATDTEESKTLQSDMDDNTDVDDIAKEREVGIYEDSTATDNSDIIQKRVLEEHQPQ